MIKYPLLSDRRNKLYKERKVCSWADSISMTVRSLDLVLKTIPLKTIGPFTPKDRFFFARRRGNSYENWDYSCIMVRQLFASSNIRHEIWERGKGKTTCGHYNVVIKLIITLLFLPISFSLYAIFNLLIYMLNLIVICSTVWTL